MMIVLTAEQAEAVRGPTGPGAALDPVPLADGETWALPPSVLSDPAHAQHHDTLAALPQREIAAEEWPAADA